MILAQNILVIGSLVGFVVLAIAWAARPVEVQDEEDTLGDDEVQDEHGYIHRTGQMPWKGDM